VPAATEGFVYAANTGEMSVLVDLLVSLMMAPPHELPGRCKLRCIPSHLRQEPHA
jgi:hypothetical protein